MRRRSACAFDAVNDDLVPEMPNGVEEASFRSFLSSHWPDQTYSSLNSLCRPVSSLVGAPLLRVWTPSGAPDFAAL